MMTSPETVSRPEPDRAGRAIIARFLRDRRAARWWLVAGIAAFLALRVGLGWMGTAADAAATFGELRPVLVAAADVAAGEPITPADVAVRQWPTGVVPPGSMAELPVGAVASQPIVAGEAVVADRVAPGGLSPIPAGLVDDQVGIAVPHGAERLPVEVGDRVAVWVTDDAGVGPRTTLVAEAAEVLATTDDGLVLGVDRADATAVIDGLASGFVTVTAMR